MIWAEVSNFLLRIPGSHHRHPRGFARRRKLTHVQMQSPLRQPHALPNYLTSIGSHALTRRSECLMCFIDKAAATETTQSKIKTLRLLDDESSDPFLRPSYAIEARTGTQFGFSSLCKSRHARLRRRGRN